MPPKMPLGSTTLTHHHHFDFAKEPQSRLLNAPEITYGSIKKKKIIKARPVTPVTQDSEVRSQIQDLMKSQCI